MLDYIREKKLVVLEHVQAQHPDMARLHPQSVNTMRICTDLVDGQVHIAYITLKMGRGGGVCDNSGQGGILCRVDIDTGKICSPATDDYFNVYDRHPDTGIPLVGYQLPMIEEAKAMACEAAREIPEVGHVAGIWPSAPTARPSSRAMTSPARTCASWPPSARRKPACGPITRSCFTCKMNNNSPAG